ncbi:MULTISPECIES: fatty acid desaturase [unclassified Ruegeria]|uniref:fatty acid desaturase n=1 Tax=unclassified Ruegeria TaxID=2625375 RepID=UPI0014894B3D|nr:MULTISPECIES: fatty acid desaturase [unclassified Ruegeria]NOD78030.1 fatty acid desaturase [Ruegeria sp. HKCCD4332]NOD87614.1 fatty acid desaturase [Ruegeria sp. HKCCD4318]NOE15647.1 fatty acid desaturase [Ruegeria sp. HKCCD4318-2]NOG08662.1 fatty acid desaturase [Ruegeria sp. HKCCD4315]
MAERPTSQSPEWGTLFLIIACYGAWLAGLFWLASLSVWLAVPALAVVAALHSSLTHEALHGHPFRTKWVNEALMALPLTLFIPYNRFRDLHLAHHQDAALTDPYDDPESNYLDPKVWSTLPRGLQKLLAVNNTLLGRMVLGPAIGQVLFLRDEWRGARHWDKDILLAWALHLPGAAVVLWVVAQSSMPVWAYLISAYFGLGLLKIRTFLEHRAHEKSRARTVIIEDRGPLAFLFLNNNLHVVHHMNPNAPWYQLPQLYEDGKDRYLACNEAYVYRSYAQIFRQYLLRAKDPVPHPLWPKS